MATTPNNAPAITQGSRTPISNVGSGASTLQNPNISARSQGSGGDFIIPTLLGGLGGFAAEKILGTDPISAIRGVLGGGGGSGGGGGAGGGGGGMPTGDLGSVNRVLMPPSSTQFDVNQRYGTSNGQPNYVITGVDMGTGQIIASPNNNIGGTNLTGIGGFNPEDLGVRPEGQSPGSFFQDSFGNIYDQNGELYAVKSGGTYYVADQDTPDTWMNADTGSVIDTNTLFGYTGGGYDPTQDFYDTDDYFANSDTSLWDTNYDPYTDFYDTDEYFASDDSDWWDWFGKDGGMPTPMMASGGLASAAQQVQAEGRNGDTMLAHIHPAEGKFLEMMGGGTTNPTTGLKEYSGALSAITSLLSSGGVQGALIGAFLSQIMGGSSSGGINQGVDMSKLGNIPPRTTNFGMGPANYVPQSAYSPPRQPSNQFNQINADLGASGFTPTFSPLNFLGRNPLRRAEGGMVNQPRTHYTFGTAVNPMDNMMAEGGMPLNTNVPALEGMHQNTHVPIMHGRKDYRKGAAVEGAGDGQSDDIPAMLADGEYVIDADVVAALGNGSNKAGSKVLDEFRENIRKHKRSADLDKIPPKAKSPLAYLKGAK
jgi:hypothetical protein